MKHSRFGHLILALLGGALIVWSADQSAAQQQAQAEDELFAFAQSSAATYDAIRFVVTRTQDTSELKPLAAEFDVLLDRFDKNFAAFAASVSTTTDGRNSRRLAALNEIKTALAGIGSAIRANDSDALVQNLIAAKFGVRKLNDLIGSEDLPVSDSPEIENGDGGTNNRRLAELEEIVRQAQQRFSADQKELKRAGDLFSAKALSRSEWDNVRERFDQSRTELQLARANLDAHRSVPKKLNDTGKQGRRINSLTHVTIDGNRVSFFGRYDPQGPRSIPYDQIFAAAVRLRDEKVDPQTQATSPAFTFVPAAGFQETEAEFRAKSRNFDEMVAATQQFYETDVPARERYLKSAREQALPEIRVALKRMLSSRMKAAQIDARINLVTSDEMLTQTLRQLFRDGILSNKDGDELLFYLNRAIEVYQSTLGNLFFYPDGTAEGVIKKCLFLEPQFAGIDPQTDFARIVFDSDVALKDLIGDYSLAEKLPFHKTYIEWRFKNLPVALILNNEPAKAIQLWPGTIRLSLSNDGRVLAFDKVDVAIKIRTAYSDAPPTAGDSAYANHLTAHYDDYAREIDSLWEFRELLKVLAAVRQLKSQGVELTSPPPRVAWEPPSVVRAKWRVVSVGTGDNYIVSTGFSGGVMLQVQNQIQLTLLPDARAKQLMDQYGRAPGRPIGDVPQLLNMDRPDAIANLREMTPAELDQMTTQLSQADIRLKAGVAEAKSQELTLQMKTAAPLDYRTWRDAVTQVVRTLPGVEVAERLGEDAARDLAGVTGTKTESFYRHEGTYQKGVDSVLDTKELGEIISRDFKFDPRETRFTIYREIAQIGRVVVESESLEEATLKSLPHFSKIFEQAPPYLAIKLAQAKNNPALAGNVTLATKLFVVASKFAIETTHATADVWMVNRGLRAARNTNNMLLWNAQHTRTELERKQRENAILLELVKAEQRTRSSPNP
jgi:hypothetical protein